MSYLNKHGSGRFILAYTAHAGYCAKCFPNSPSDVINHPDRFCDEGRAFAAAWVDAFQKETPEGSDYQLGKPPGSQPYKMREACADYCPAEFDAYVCTQCGLGPDFHK